MEDSSIEKQDVTDSAIAVVQVSVGVGNSIENYNSNLGRPETGEQ